MSRKPENKFMDAVHKQLPDDAIYKMKITPVFTSGEFDTFYEGHARDLFVEYKFLELPKRYETMIYFDKMLSPNQLKWGNRRVERTAASDRVPPHLAIGCREKGRYFGLFLQYTPDMTPINTKTFRDNLLSAKEIADRILSLVS
jgi:hypothetical protein